MGDHLLDFVADPANITFGGSGGMRDDIPTSPNSGMKGKVSVVVLHRLHPQVCSMQLVTLDEVKSRGGEM